MIAKENVDMNTHRALPYRSEEMRRPRVKSIDPNQCQAQSILHVDVSFPPIDMAQRGEYSSPHSLSQSSSKIDRLTEESFLCSLGNEHDRQNRSAFIGHEIRSQSAP